MEKLKKKKGLIIGLGILVVVLAAGGITFAVRGIKDIITAFINVPDGVVEESLGTYLLPEYEVVDANGMILAGYQVDLQSVTGPDGEALDASWDSLMVETPGIYEFVYTAGVENVRDETVQVDFGDRTAPSIKLTGTLPDFYITGNAYKMPSYTVEGDAEISKCWTGVFYLPEDGKEQEVALKNNQFLVDQESGSYIIRIHVEDNAGNANEYEYARSVDGPEHFEADTVLYFGEEFGVRQVELLESSKYTGEFVSKEQEPDRVYGEESGSYKLTFSGEETEANEGYVVMKTPAILDISNCQEMGMYVYNDGEADVIMGSRWWNDQVVKAGEWTRVVWPVNGWGGENGNVGTDNIKTISAGDISGTVIRILFDYSGEVAPSGTLYFSPMKVVRREESELIAGEHVLLDRTTYWQGETVQLRAEEIEGKVVDCFLADDIPLTGDTFIPTKAKHTITVRYVDQLSYDTMTWGRYSYEPKWWGNEAWLTGNNCVAKGINEEKNWALSFDVTGGYDPDLETNQLFGVAVMLGTEHIIEFQVNHYSDSVCKWYGEGAWEDTVSVLPQEVVERFMNASSSNPANVQVIRREGDIYLFVDEFFIGKTAIGDKPVRGDWFGYGARVEQKGVATPKIKNLKAVSGEERTGFVYEAKKYYLQVADYEAIAVIDGDIYQAPLVQVKDVEGNAVKGAKTWLTAVSEGGDSFSAKGRNVTIPYGGAVNLRLTYQADHPENSGKLKASARMTVQKRSGVIMEPDPVAVPTINPDGNEVAFDNSISHGGDHGAIRVTAKEGDVAVFLNIFDFTGYDYVDYWVYTEAQDTISGSYWLGDTALKPGAWTRVRIKLADENVYLKDEKGADYCPNKWHKGQPYRGRLALRFMGEGCGKGVSFWVSSVQAGAYGPVTVTTKNCSTDKSSYMQGDTIHLNPEAPEGMILDYFSINGERTDALSIEALDREYVIEAFYRPKNTVLYINEFGVEGLGAGESRVEYDRNLSHGEDQGSVKVTVSGEDNGVFLRSYNFTGYDYVVFYVYTNTEGTQAGSWWCGDTPLRPGKWTKVYVRLNEENLVLTNPILGDLWPNKNGEVKEGRMIARLFGTGCTEGTEFWLSSVKAYCKDPASVSGEALMVVNANTDDFSLQHEAKSAVYTTQRAYDGPNKLVTGSENGSMKVTVGGPEAGVAVAEACIDDISHYNEVYFYVYTEGKNARSGGWWCGDTPLSPGQWTKITLTKEMGPQNLAGQSIFTGTPNNFVYRFMGGSDGDVFYATSLYASKATGPKEASVSAKNVITDKDSYQQGETVTLTASVKAPAGLKILYVVNGKPLAGDTFVMEDVNKKYTAEALLCNPATEAVPVLGTGGEQVLFQDGARAEGYGTQKLYDGDDPLVRAYETGSLKVKLTGPEAAVSVSNTLISDISGYDSVYFYAYTDAPGLQAGAWWCGDTPLTPGQWTRITLPKIMIQRAVGPWNLHGQLIFTEGPDGFVYRFMGGKDGDVCYVTSLYAERLPVEPVKDHMKLYGCKTDRDGYKKGQTVILTAAEPPAGLETGGFMVNGQRIEGNTFTYLGEMVYTVEAWYRNLETQGVKVQETDSEWVSPAPEDCGTAEYVTNKKYDGSDELVKASDRGVLKVTPASGKADIGICIGGALEKDLSGYDELYFYVYTDAQNMRAGSWWTGDIDLTPGQWTKVTLSDRNALVNVGYGKIFENGPDNFVYRFMSNDYATPMAEGTTFYVTSLYAVKLSPDPVEGHIALKGCTTDKNAYKYGETVTLKAAQAPTGLEAAGFAVNGKRIEGDTFTYRGGQLYTVEALYRNPGTQGVKVLEVNTAQIAPQHDGGTVAYVTDKKYNGDDALVKASDSGVLKVTVGGGEAGFAVNGAIVSDISGYDKVYFYVYTDAQNTQSGGWWCGDTPLTPGQWTRVTLTKEMGPQNPTGQSIFAAGPDNFVYRFMGGTNGIVFYVTSLYAEMKPAPAKVNDIQGVDLSTAHTAGVSAGYDASKKYDGGDALVKGGDAAGSMKLTITDNEAAFSVPGAVTNDIRDYDQVYYYAYTDDANVKAGGWWCGDTDLTPGQWTKVVLPRTGGATAPQNKDGQNIFEAGPNHTIYRFMNASGATVYVTSIYAEYKN